jgi:pimeloyl-ACP methyl ester carboxylesterase
MFSSEAADEMSYDSMVEDLYYYFTSNNVKKAYLCGYCIGGRIAMKFASKYPELTKGIILIEASVGSLEIPSFDVFIRVL